MEQLELPYDLIWEGKLEPLSPSELAISKTEDVLIFENDYFAKLAVGAIDLLVDADLSEFDVEKTPEEMLIELQQDMMSEDGFIGCEPDSINDDCSSFSENESESQWVYHISTPPQQYTPPRFHGVKIENTAELIREFDTVCGSIGLTNLTPPQTPPQSPLQNTIGPTGYDLLNDEKTIYFFNPPTISQPDLEPTGGTYPKSFTNQPEYVVESSEPYVHQNIESLVPASPMIQDIAREMEVVDELVRSCAQDLPDYSQPDDYCMDDDDSSSSSSTSSHGFSSPRSDDDWAPPKVDGGGVTKRRPRPYGKRSPDDRKSRKKEQNKNAATRYRQKKRAEIEIILDEERELKKINDDLKEKNKDVEREVKYLKSLLRDLFRAKGILK